MSADAKAPDNGAARSMTRDEMALHYVRAQLHAIRAQVDGALAALALLDGSGLGGPINGTLRPSQPNADRQRRPRTEAEADFFGKLKEKQTPAGAEANA